MRAAVKKVYFLFVVKSSSSRDSLFFFRLFHFPNPIPETPLGIRVHYLAKLETLSVKYQVSLLASARCMCKFDLLGGKTFSFTIAVQRVEKTFWSLHPTRKKVCRIQKYSLRIRSDKETKLTRPGKIQTNSKGGGS